MAGGGKGEVPTHREPAAIVVYGGGGQGRVVIDLLSAVRIYRIVGVIDDGLTEGESVQGFPVLGGKEVLPELRERVGLAVNAVGGIGNVARRREVFETLAGADFRCPAIAHSDASIEASAAVAEGVQILARAYVGSNASVGFGSIVNVGSVVSHDCTLGELVNLSPGALLAGDVEVGAGSQIGMGATVNLGLRIGPGASVGNGATVKADVPAGGVVRAGTIWPN